MSISDNTPAKSTLRTTAADRRRAAETSADVAESTQATASEPTEPAPATAATEPLTEAPLGILDTDAEDRPAPREPRPRIRWGAIAWAIIVGSIAALTLSVTRTAAGRADFALWLAQLTPGGIWLIVVLTAGGILFLLGLLSVIRRAQRAR
ncbi:MAG: hypothetical protein ABI400_07485 [Lacisediminihabitans sp.]